MYFNDIGFLEIELEKIPEIYNPFRIKIRSGFHFTGPNLAGSNLRTETILVQSGHRRQRVFSFNTFYMAKHLEKKRTKMTKLKWNMNVRTYLKIHEEKNFKSSRSFFTHPMKTIQNTSCMFKSIKKYDVT